MGHKVRNRHQLLNYLKDREKEGIGGVRMTDVIEALPNPERAVKVCVCVCVCSSVQCMDGCVCMEVCMYVGMYMCVHIHICTYVCTYLAYDV